MDKTEIVKTLNEKYKGKFVFDITDNQEEIVGFVDDKTFTQIIAVITPSESEMNRVIDHLEKHAK